MADLVSSGQTFVAICEFGRTCWLVEVCLVSFDVETDLMRRGSEPIGAGSLHKAIVKNTSHSTDSICIHVQLDGAASSRFSCYRAWVLGEKGLYQRGQPGNELGDFCFNRDAKFVALILYIVNGLLCQLFNLL